MKDVFSAEEVEKRLGYVFRDKRLLKEAFTHSSYANRYGCVSNERLEFLGDSVLQLVVSEELYKKQRQSEGQMTAVRAKAVSKEPLEKAVLKLDVKKFLLTDGNENENVGKKAVSSLFESVLAAIYLDGDGANGDGYKNAAAFVKKHVEMGQKVNYKGELQEFLQGKKLPLPVYGEPIKTGAENAPHFQVKVVSRGESAVGEGTTKKEAENEAAKKLLERLSRRG